MEGKSYFSARSLRGRLSRRQLSADTTGGRNEESIGVPCPRLRPVGRSDACHLSACSPRAGEPEQLG